MTGQRFGRFFNVQCILFNLDVSLTCTATWHILLIASFLQLLSLYSMDIDDSFSTESAEDGKEPCQCSVCKGSNWAVSRWTRQRHANDDRTRAEAAHSTKRQRLASPPSAESVSSGQGNFNSSNSEVRALQKFCNHLLTELVNRQLLVDPN